MSDELRESRTRMSGGSLRHRKLNFDDVTVEHDCVLRDRQKVINRNGDSLITLLLFMTVVSKTHPKTKKHFQSSDAVYKEITRHMFSNYWYIIHPYSKLRFYWSFIMVFVNFLWFIHVPFVFSFHNHLGNKVWLPTIGSLLNCLCLCDVFLNFFTGYKAKHGNFVVLHHGSIIQNYLQHGRFYIDFLSTLPLCSAYRIYFDICVEKEIPKISLAIFFVAYLLKFLRFLLMSKMWKDSLKLMKCFKLSYLSTVIIMLLLKTFISIHFSICIYKIVATGIIMIYSDETSPKIDYLFADTSVTMKYLDVLETIVWSLFDTSFGNEIEMHISGKFMMTFCILFGVAYNMYILVQVLNLLNIIHKPRTKYYEVMNQLDAYMQKKQLPMPLQNRLKFFYKKKFRRFYYREDEILGILSEPLQREILLNTNKFFAERVKLFNYIPKNLVSKIAESCKKEQFLPNDLIIKAGSIGNCMFFIASGSVCATTSNGMELCHLGDGDYFGEVALILKNSKHIATVTAIEFCEAYILENASFKKYVQINEAIMQKLTETAEQRMKLTLEAEEEHKKRMQAKIARESFID